MNILAIIPARYASSRFPGKPLALVHGKPMIQRVYEQASKVFENVCVATDDERIYNAVAAFGGKAVMTSDKHSSGTDRCYEALQNFSAWCGCSFDVVVNVQGDEPYIQPEQLKLLADCFNDSGVEIATLVKRVKTCEEFLNQNAPKVVISKNSYALYFSRAAIPFPRDKEITEEFVANTTLYRHIGLYGYRADILAEICAMEQGFLEKTEKLEQLRWLEAGLKIKVAETKLETYAVDTPGDLEFINSQIF